MIPKVVGILKPSFGFGTDWNSFIMGEMLCVGEVPEVGFFNLMILAKAI